MIDSCQRSGCCGLSASGLTNQRQDLAFPDSERNVVHSPYRIIRTNLKVLFQIISLYQHFPLCRIFSLKTGPHFFPCLVMRITNRIPLRPFFQKYRLVYFRSPFIHKPGRSIVSITDFKHRRFFFIINGKCLWISDGKSISWRRIKKRRRHSGNRIQDTLFACKNRK